jgi:glutamine synthetase
VSTDLERFVATDGRDEAVARVRSEIDAKGISYIYYQFASVTGRIMGKGVPADHWERIAGRGFQLVYGSTANLFTDRHGNYIGYGPEAWELVGMPDVETFCQLPWDPKTARVFCTLFRNREEEVDPGGYLTSDCRGNLRRIHEAFERDTGLHLRVGTEPEMMWLKVNPDGTPSVEGKTKPYCYHIDQFAELQPLIHKVMEYGKAMGLDMIQGDHEDAPGQLELNFRFDRPVKTADNITTYRQVCAAVGRKHGLLPSFMPKPFTGVSANGHHHHFTLVDDEGTNVFHDPSGPAELSDIARHFLGGMLDHFGALMCVGNPTVNSYCRMWDFGFWAPVYKNWGWQNRTCTVRVASGGRF